MIKRDIVETVYEYDNEGKLLRKTVTETHEDDDNTSVSWQPRVYCDISKEGDLASILAQATSSIDPNCVITAYNDGKADVTEAYCPHK